MIKKMAYINIAANETHFLIDLDKNDWNSLIVNDIEVHQDKKTGHWTYRQDGTETITFTATTSNLPNPTNLGSAMILEGELLYDYVCTVWYTVPWAIHGILYKTTKLANSQKGPIPFSQPLMIGTFNS